VAIRAPQVQWDSPAAGLGLREHLRAEAERRREEQEEEKADDRPRTMRAWALMVPERGITLDLREFPFQEAWYSEEIANAREVVWQKAAQVGMSGYAWRWAARRAAHYGDRVIYFFPTDDDVSDFGDQRIEPSIVESAFLLAQMPHGSVRHKHLKQIGTGFLALRGTQSSSAVQSVDADALVFDEYEYLNQKNLAQAERRIAGAMAAGRQPRIRRFGYPTVHGSGINSHYQRSDRREWHVTCPACDLEQPLTWADNMRWRTFENDEEVSRWGHDEFEDHTQVAEAWRACKSCDASLEPAEEGELGPIHTGRWIATNPEGRVPGFSVSRLIVPRTDLIELVRNSRKTAPHEQEAFWNNDLGLPFSPAEAALSEEQILAACSYGREQVLSYRGRNPRVAGVDVASERNLSMWIDELMPDGTTLALWIGEPMDFKEVAEKIRTYGVAMTVIDSMPERRMARSVAATFPGRVVLASYDDRNESDAFRYDPKKNLVTVNRTEGIDAFMDGIRQLRRIPIKRPAARFVSQLMSPKRRTVLDTKGRPKRVYESTGPDGDDYAHAGVYGLVAKELYVLKAQVDAQLAAAAGETVADERLGFQGVDDYRPGFNEEMGARWR
jgi:hypothetical protein